MPRMATRLGAARTTEKGIARRGTAMIAASLVLGLAVGASPGAATGESASLFPAPDARLLDTGTGGWAASFGVTAANCSPGDCPTLESTWTADAGRGGTGDGALGVTLRGVHAHAGVATATLRSPMFVVPAEPLAATFGIAVRTAAANGASGGVASTLAVDLVDVNSGTRRTIVEPRPTGATGGAWTDVAGNELTSGALRSSGVYRLEVTVRFSLAADGAPDTTVLLDRPTLSVGVAEQTAAGATPTLAPVLSPPVPPDPATVLPVATPDHDADDAQRASDDADADAAGTCDDPVELLGAGAIGRRVLVAGVADLDAGTRVNLLSPDGWALGEATVAADGTFAASLVAPRAAGAPRTLLARAAEGERSPLTAVARQHVLQAVTAKRSRVVIDGVVAPSWLGGRTRASLDVLLPVGGPCGAPKAYAAGTVKIDPRTGHYQAVLRAGTRTYAQVRGAEVVSTRLTRPNGRAGRVRTTSALTVGPGSDTQEAGP